MDTSIPGPSKTNHSSQPTLKRPASSTRLKPAKKRKKAIESIDFDGDDAYNSRLSAKTRDTVLKLRKIKDPFDPELQEVVDDVFVHIDNQPCDNVDLAESALLLSGVTQVFSSQVLSLHEEVLAMAARLTGRENPKRGRGRKTVQKLEDIPLKEKNENEKENSEDNDAKKESEQGDGEKPENGQGESEAVGEGIGENTTPEVGDDADNVELPSANGEGIEGNNTNAEGDSSENKEALPENSENDPQAGPVTEPTIDELKRLESDLLNDIPARCTRRQSERLKNIINMEIEAANERDYKLKKRKFDDDPPELISCHEEWEKISQAIKDNGDVDFDEIMPPVLEVQVGRRKKKVMLNNNEMDIDDDNDCETCHHDLASKSGSDDTEKVEETPSSFLVPLPPGLDGQKYETLDHLPTDVQESFHALVQEMHKLPFDYGLMQQDMFKVYQQKFVQAVSLLSQNSVLVKRTEEDKKDKESPAKVSERNDSFMSESDETLSSVSELLRQVRQQATEEYNKGKQSKEDADVPVSQMIATLKRIICSRYKKWHLRTDSDKAVFKRIKEFEDKVKSVLIKEAEQGLFDVKKYEMEVMDATLKESQESESDEFGCPGSPLPYLTGCPESPGQEESRNWSLTSTPTRRSSIAGSVDGSSSWIRLIDIFTHMKKIDNSETCRHFYAVLALLSHQNLSINYDTLFSKESAKLITKLMKKQPQHGSLNLEKYPVGAKIMTSRCPDVEQDDIMLAPVLTAAFKQVLEQDGYLSSSGYQSDSQGSSNTSTSYSQPKSIQDAISEFVMDPGEPMSIDNLFSTRKRKK